MKSRTKWANWKQNRTNDVARNYTNLAVAISDNWNWSEFKNEEVQEIIDILGELEQESYGSKMFTKGIRFFDLNESPVEKAILNTLFGDCDAD